MPLPPNLITGVTARLPGDYVAQPTLKKRPTKRQASTLEQTFARLWLMLSKGTPRCYAIVGEYRFDADRKWRFDFAFPAELVAVELEGGKWIRGRHQHPKGFQADLEKYNAAAAAGWTVLRFTADDLRKDPLGVVAQVERALGMRGAK